DWHHIDLADNIYTNPGEIPGNGIDDDGNGFVDDVHGWDFVNNDNDPYDDAGHGSHVAGTIAAVGNNGIGVVGVSWSAKILPIKFLNSGGSGSTADAILSVEYATLMHVRLTNNSWGGGGFSTALRDAIEAAGDEGILFVAAAGNYGENTDIYPHYPSSYDLDNIISVANTTDRDLLSGSSNYGAVTVDLGAPGTNILSTFPGNTYGSISGTSMATPHVSGAVSLLWSAGPSLGHLDVKDIIMSSVDPNPVLAGRTVSGGRLNVFNMLTGLDSIPPARVNDLAVESTGSNTVTLSWTATGDDSTYGTASAYDLRYSTSQIYWNNFDAATPVPGMPSPQPSGAPETFMVTGLDFTTTYYFALVAVDEQDNRSWISNILVSGTTLGVPALDYGPASFDDSLRTGGSSTHTLTIRNVGEGTLDFVFPGAEMIGPSALPSWLRVEPSSGRVWAGESMDVEFNFDATGLFEGDYSEPVVLETNDPGNASVPIPATLHVTNAPDIAVAPAAMDFGDVYLGLSKPGTLVVTNIGTQLLTVVGLQIDEPQFSVDPAGFTLGLGDSRAVPVTFAPVNPGAITGTLSIESDDPDHPTLTVALEGVGVEPPVITVSPPSLSENLYTGGMSTQTLTIGNTGGSDLDFELSVEDVGGAMNAVDVIADVSLLRRGCGRRHECRRCHCRCLAPGRCDQGRTSARCGRARRAQGEVSPIDLGRPIGRHRQRRPIGAPLG
ncbi:MAG: S8 family serine peptidase, partial [bacterium]